MDWRWETDPGWWNVVIEPGMFQKRPHTSHRPQSWTPLGHYQTTRGVIGGFYDGDEHWVEFSNDPGFDVVSEPVTFVGLAFAVGALAARRRG